MKRSTYLSTLSVVFALLWLGLAVHPHDRSDWWLENILVIAAVAALIASSRALRFSRLSYTAIFAFMCLHVVGAHYTYSEVPYREWFHAIGAAAPTEDGRNYFDRVVHFCYGLLLVQPIREVFLRVANVRGFWSYFLPLDLTMSTSMLYELMECAAAVFFGGDLGAAFLGSQGDPWDAQKDMALASLGALLAMTLTAVVHARTRRDFAAEWVESLRVKK